MLKGLFQNLLINRICPNPLMFLQGAQGCLPRGNVCPEGVSAQGGVWPGSVWPGVSPQGVSAQGRVCPREVLTAQRGVWLGMSHYGVSA